MRPRKRHLYVCASFECRAPVSALSCAVTITARRGIEISNLMIPHLCLTLSRHVLLLRPLSRLPLTVSYCHLSAINNATKVLGVRGTKYFTSCKGRSYTTRTFTYNRERKFREGRTGDATVTELMLMRRPGQPRLIAGLYYASAACSRSLNRALIAP